MSKYKTYLRKGTNLKYDELDLKSVEKKRKKISHEEALCRRAIARSKKILKMQQSSMENAKTNVQPISAGISNASMEEIVSGNLSGSLSEESVQNKKILIGERESLLSRKAFSSRHPIRSQTPTILLRMGKIYLKYLRCDETNVVEHNFLKRLSDAERELKNCKEEFARKEHAYEETIQKLEETIQELKEKLQDSTERESMCQTELFILQQELKQKEKLDLLLNLNLEIQQKIIHKLDGQQPFSPSTVFVREGTHDHDGIEIGAGISISERGWARIKSHASASLFVKDLAALIWDESVLREKSVTGRKCPTVNGDAKPPLTPQKVEVINDTLRKVLRERGVDSSAIEKEIKSVNRYLREKINDLQRKFKKHCRSTVNIELQQRTMEVTDENEAPKEQ